MGVNLSHKLPAMAPDANNAAVALELLTRLDHQFFREPTDGFVVRLALLFGLTVFFILLSCIYFAWMWLESRRRGSNGDTASTFWLFRRVRRPASGVYYVPAQKPVASVLGAIVVGLPSIFYVYDLYRVYIVKQPMENMYRWRAYVFIPFFINGWITSGAGMLALILATEHERWRSLIPYRNRRRIGSSEADGGKVMISARWANGLFIGGGLFLMLVGIAAATPCAIAGDQLWDTYLILKPQLEAIAADTTGDNDPSVLAAMSDGYSRIIDGWEKYFSTATIAFAVIAVLPFLISVANIASLMLARLLQQQIDMRKEMISGVIRLGEYDSVVEAGGGSSVRASSDKRGDGDDRKTPARQSSTSTNSSGKSAQSAQPSEVDRGLAFDASQQVRALVRAKRDLVLVAWAVGTITACFTVLCIGISVAASTGELLEDHWYLWELAVTAPIWISSTIEAFIFVACIHNAARHRRQHPTSSSPSPSPAQFQQAEVTFDEIFQE